MQQHLQEDLARQQNALSEARKQAELENQQQLAQLLALQENQVAMQQSQQAFALQQQMNPAVQGVWVYDQASDSWYYNKEDGAQPLSFNGSFSYDLNKGKENVFFKQKRSIFSYKKRLSHSLQTVSYFIPSKIIRR